MAQPTEITEKMMYYTDPTDKGKIYDNGSIEYRTPYPFSTISKIKNCPIAGTYLRRTATITNYPDTYFSIPARIKYKEKYISGFVSCSDEGYYFVPYQYGKNYHVLQS